MSHMSKVVIALVLILVVLAGVAVVSAERLRATSEQRALEARIDELEQEVREGGVAALVDGGETDTLREKLAAAEARVASLEETLEAANKENAALIEDAYPEQLRRSIVENHRITEHEYTVSGGRAFGYLLYEPCGLDASEPHPLVVYLHGTGSWGNRLEYVYSEDSLPELLRDGVLTPNAYVLMPQCPWGGAWQDMPEEIMELIEHVVAETGADRSRISITGFSLGGIGVFYMLVNYPEYFSAAAPFAGAYSNTPDCAVITSTPVRMIHGSYDSSVGMSVYSINMTIRAAGGQSELLLYSGDEHAVQRHYADDNGAIVEWLIAQKREDK